MTCCAFSARARTPGSAAASSPETNSRPIGSGFSPSSSEAAAQASAAPRPLGVQGRWKAPEPPAAKAKGLELVRYRPLFSGPAVERVPELQFQRPEAEIELAPADAAARKIATGDPVTVSHNGTSLELRARVSRGLREGVARIPSTEAGELGGRVEVKK